MKHPIITITFAAILVSFITVCGAAPVKPASGPKAAAAYGNISLPYGYISDVVMYKVVEGDVPPIEWAHKSHVYPNGDFFFENVEPGKYFLRGFTAGREKFDFNYRGVNEAEFLNGASVEIKPGSITYMGSYDVAGIDKKFQKGADFEIAHSKTAARMLILRYLKEQAKIAGWNKHFEKAMK